MLSAACEAKSLTAAWSRSPSPAHATTASPDRHRTGNASTQPIRARGSPGQKSLRTPWRSSMPVAAVSACPVTRTKKKRSASAAWSCRCSSAEPLRSNNNQPPARPAATGVPIDEHLPLRSQAVPPGARRLHHRRDHRHHPRPVWPGLWIDRQQLQLGIDRPADGAVEHQQGFLVGTRFHRRFALRRAHPGNRSGAAVQPLRQKRH
ncbi:hypothetical protein D3C81_1508380 [compost metagenome]